MVFSGLGDEGTRSAALSGGAASYVLKTGDVGVLLRTLHDLGKVYERSAGGRGLHIIASLCTAWGEDSTSDGTVVWAELSC